MSIRQKTALISFVGLLAVAGNPGLAQSPDANKPGSAMQRPNPINLQFGGGSLSEYVQALRSAMPMVNVVITTEAAGQIKFPPIKLDSVDLVAAIELMEGEYTLPDQQPVHVQVRGYGSFTGESAPVFKVSTVPIGKRAHREVSVWNIGDLLHGERKPDSVLTAVETGVGLLNQSSAKADIRYHEETSLLVASGDPEQLTAIDRVIDRIRQGAAHEHELAAAMAGSDAIGGLFEWIEGMRKFDAEQEAKAANHEETAAKVEELTRLLQNVKTELEKKDQRIAELERRLADKGKQ